MSIESPFRQMDRERAVAVRLRAYGLDLFEGLTTLAERREKARAAILEFELEETCADDFEATYGQPLHSASAA